jgi:hypothetical protein
VAAYSTLGAPPTQPRALRLGAFDGVKARAAIFGIMLFFNPPSRRVKARAAIFFNLPGSCSSSTRTFWREAREMIDRLFVIRSEPRRTVGQALASPFFAIGR